MIVSIHQPQYLPRMQYFDKIAKSDIFVFFDDVQFSNNNFQHYNYIENKTKLRVPITYRFGDPINEVMINKSIQWQELHIERVKAIYGRSPHIDEVLEFLNECYKEDYQTLSDLACMIITRALEKFGIDTDIIMASLLEVEGKKQERVINVCKAVHATEYLSGEGARAYQTESTFDDAGIKLSYIVNDKGYNNLSFIDFVAKNGFIY